MLLPATPIEEKERLAALYRLDILDSACEDKYDKMTRVACETFEVCTSMLTFVDSNRQWFKSTSGLDAKETPREISLCAHTILQEGCFVVEDALLDSRFADHPMVVAEPYFRFYAACPVHDPSGFRVGSFCILHTDPRNFDCTDFAKLSEVARIIEAEIERDYIDSLVRH